MATLTETPAATLELPADLPDFEAYLRENRSSVAGQPLEITSLAVDISNDAVPRFVLVVAGDEANNVLATQPANIVLDYGRLLLEDAKRYRGGEHCAIVVESTYAASDTNPCSSEPAWCRVGAYDQATGTWQVTWEYVRGSFLGGPDTVEARNEGR